MASLYFRCLPQQKKRGETPGRSGAMNGFVSSKTVPRPHKCGGLCIKCPGGRVAGGLGALCAGTSAAGGEARNTVVAAADACTARTVAALVAAGMGFRAAHHNTRFVPLFFLRRFACPGSAEGCLMKQTLGAC